VRTRDEEVGRGQPGRLQLLRHQEARLEVLCPTRTVKQRALEASLTQLRS